MQRPAGRSCAIDAISVLQADLYICDVVVVIFQCDLYICDVARHVIVSGTCKSEAMLASH